MPAISATPEWRAIVDEHATIAARHLRELFAADPDRAARLTFEVGDLTVDLSKHRIGVATVDRLAAVGRRAGVPETVAAMFLGQRINATEQRPVLHVALRAPRGERIVVDEVDVVPAVHDVLDRMARLADAVRSGEWRGHTGSRIRTVVNIGIGGSHLGPAMAHAALRHLQHPDLDVRFVSNVDGDDLAANLADLDPAETLFIVVSKTFTTLETLTNARSARAWLTSALGDDAVMRHFVAVSTNADEVQTFGIDVENMFEIWDWVGGRYSMGSAVGLAVMIAIGADAFREMLRGFRIVDEHLRDTPLERNVPVLLGLLDVWYVDLFGCQSKAVLPYSHQLSLFPDHLQQLDMESNGKSVTIDGAPAPLPTGPVVWGTPGTNGQHAYFQLLHQGSVLVPADLIGFARPARGLDGHHDLLIANLFAQAEALAFGRTADEVSAEGVSAELVAHRTFPGNRPTTTILAPALTPSVLGQLVALYEHRTLAAGVVWGINSFDQWGVELGKALASRIAPELQTGAERGVHDGSTERLIARYRTLTGRG